MKLHPRTLVVQEAEGDLGRALSQVSEKHALTVAEVVTILCRVLEGHTKYLLRMERHGTTDKKADEA